MPTRLFEEILCLWPLSQNSFTNVLPLSADRIRRKEVHVVNVFAEIFLRIFGGRCKLSWGPFTFVFGGYEGVMHNV